MWTLQNHNLSYIARGWSIRRTYRKLGECGFDKQLQFHLMSPVRWFISGLPFLQMFKPPLKLCTIFHVCISPCVFVQSQFIKASRLLLSTQTQGKAKSMEVHPSVFFISIIHAQWNTKCSAKMVANPVLSLVTQRSGEMWTSHSQSKTQFFLDSTFSASLKDNPSVTVECSGGSIRVSPFPYPKPLNYVESVQGLLNPTSSSTWLTECANSAATWCESYQIVHAMHCPALVCVALKKGFLF